MARRCLHCREPLRRRQVENGEPYEGPSQFKRRKCCNQEHYLAYQREKYRKTHKPCGNEECSNTVLPSAKYCSLQCCGHGCHQDSLRKVAQDKPRHCKACGEKLELREGEVVWSFRARVTCGSGSCVARYSWTKKKRRKSRKCEGCGKKYPMRTKQRFHSRPCYFDHLKKKKWVTLECTGCGKKFQRRKFYVSGSKRAFHNVECWRKHTAMVKTKAVHVIPEEERRSILMAYAREGTRSAASIAIGVPYARARRVINEWEAQQQLSSRMKKAALGFTGRAYSKTPASKIRHRKAVAKFLLREGAPHRVLTLPGPNVDFEKRLLAQGCQEIVCVERNPVLYERFLLFLDPLQRTGEELGTEVTPAAKNGSIRALNTDLASLVSLEEQHPLSAWIDTTYLSWDGVWLDFCGNLNARMLRLLRKVAAKTCTGASVAISVLGSRDRGISSDAEREKLVRESMNLTDEGTYRYISEKKSVMLTVFGKTTGSNPS